MIVDFRTREGQQIYAGVTGAAFLAGSFISLLTLSNLAWAGTASIIFDVAVLAANLSTMGLFVGMIAYKTERQSIVIATLISSAFVPVCILGLFIRDLWPPHTNLNLVQPLWLVFLMFDGLQIYFAVQKLKQLRTTR